MALVPAICDTCGTIWGTPNLISGTGSKITFTGRNTVSPCPNCGGEGSIPNGVYDLMDDTLQVVRSASVPAPVLQLLLDLLRDAAKGQATDDEVLQRVQKEAPALEPTFRRAIEQSGPLNWITALIAVISLCLQLTQAGPPSADEVAHALREEPLPVRIGPERKATRPAAKPTRAKRPGKTYGKNKRRKRH